MWQKWCLCTLVIAIETPFTGLFSQAVQMKKRKPNMKEKSLLPSQGACLHAKQWVSASLVFSLRQNLLQNVGKSSLAIKQDSILHARPISLLNLNSMLVPDSEDQIYSPKENKNHIPIKQYEQFTIFFIIERLNSLNSKVKGLLRNWLIFCFLEEPIICRTYSLSKCLPNLHQYL